jgi:outer membrane protein OmpA-like peptidoglycan-associated protein
MIMKISSTRCGSLAMGMLAATLLQACAGTPAQNAQFNQAQEDYAAASSDPKVIQAAPEQLRDASGNLHQAAVLLQHRAPQDDVDHYAHLASLNVTTARELADADASQASVRQAAGRRSELQLQSSQRQTRQAQSEAANANAQAASASVAADAAQERNAALLEALDAKQTDRGLVLTLGSVMFDSGAADLNSGGERNLDKLVQFLRDNPGRNVRVEGYTDSTGSAVYNRDLSRRRADAVRTALVDSGLDMRRIVIKGFGEEFPVAGNDTASGRQQNRRVEIVISDADGGFAQIR